MWIKTQADTHTLELVIMLVLAKPNGSTSLSLMAVSKTLPKLMQLYIEFTREQLGQNLALTY